MKRLVLLLFGLLMMSGAFAQTYAYPDAWGPEGFSLGLQSRQGVILTYSVNEFGLNDIDIRGEAMKQVSLAGHFLPGDEGMPDLPGSGRYIALPQGATPVLHIKSMRREVYRDISIAPAPRIPKTTENGPLEYNKNSRAYQNNSFYPAEPVQLSEVTTVRGVDAVILGITPFQYNPVTRELVVIRDIEVEVEFQGGNGQFGEERYRSRWWDPILQDLFLNHASLPAVDYSKRLTDGTRSTGFEYLIISPDDPVFLSWADTIRMFRTKQGIYTGIVTTTEIGGNTTAAIESYVNNAYQTWDIPPAAILLLGDYGLTGSTIVSPIWDNYCVSDHIYADVNGDDEEEIIFARMTARNAAELEVMIRKAFDYETDPPTNPDFYDKPVTALGWQTERWFQICSEVVGGYFKTVKGKNPVRVNAVYEGNPSVDPWSTAPNTNTVLGFFGPTGLGYIPATPAELGGWTGGTAAMVNNALNAGSFLLQHRDHGYEYGWGEPDYSNTSINGLTNTDLSFIFSINCLTGKYNHSSESFAEKFHRYTYNGEPAGALGLLAASEVSYSFVNDVYVWGVFDNMFPDFMPANGTTPESRGMLPAFGNAAGKFFLKYSSWPYNTNNKEVTYNLFHHHGDAFTCLYSEVPQDLTVVHNSVQLAGVPSFTIEANEGALIALSVNGELIGVGTGTGAATDIPIVAQNPPSIIDVVVTRENYYRYMAQVQVIPPDGPFVVAESYTVNDAAGNNNGRFDYGETIQMDVTLKNLGTEDAENVVVTLASASEYVTITENTAQAGTIQPNQTAGLVGVFSITASGSVPNGQNIAFTMEASNGDTVWTSNFSVKAFAPVMEYVSVEVADPAGNNNGRLDAGETAVLNVSLKNRGGADAYNIYGLLSSEDMYIEIESDSAMYGNIGQNETIAKSFVVTAHPVTPPGHPAELTVHFAGDMGLTTESSFNVSVGLYPILILDLDGNHNSGTIMKDAIDELRVFAEYATEIPEEISHYQTIFMSLGTYNNNHILSSAEATPFVTFLNNGGNMYLEGADTWYYDQLYNPTSLHPLFKIQGTSDGSGDLGTLQGLSATFLDGITFYYGGDNSYIDRVNPVAPGYTVMANLGPVYNAVIAHDAGTYKTIGSVFEFGGLLDNELFTKRDLMNRYLNFFGLSTISEAPAQPSGETHVCGTVMPCVYTTEAVNGAEYYIWHVEPASAGEIEGWGTEVTVNWNPSFKGNAMLKVCGMNQSGMGPDSEGLSVDVYELPTGAASLSQSTVCSGDTTYLNLSLTGVSPWHLEVTLNGGLVTFDPNKPNVEIPLWPSSDMEVIIQTITDATGCIQTEPIELNITVQQAPATAAKPAGPEEIDLYSVTSSVYATTGATGASSYTWILEPAGAGTFQVSENGMECTVNWQNGFTGQATLKVRGENDCGEGGFSENLAVTVANTFGIEEHKSGLGVSIFPNPGSGAFQVELSARNITTATLGVYSAAGEPVVAPKEVTIDRKLQLPLDLGQLPEGMYMLKIQTSAGVSAHKIVVRR